LNDRCGVHDTGGGGFSDTIMRNYEDKCGVGMAVVGDNVYSRRDGGCTEGCFKAENCCTNMHSRSSSKDRLLSSKDRLLSSKDTFSDYNNDGNEGHNKHALESTCSSSSKQDNDTSIRLQHLNAQLQALEIKVSEARANLELVKSRCVRCVGGTLVLVDLAGNEYAGDEKEGRSMREVSEAKEINQSLLSLKECVRGMHAGMRYVCSVCVCVLNEWLYVCMYVCERKV
jgi:hypothetical protein